MFKASRAGLEDLLNKKPTFDGGPAESNPNLDPETAHSLYPLAERFAFEITSKTVLWQAVSETDLRTKNMAALQDQVRTYLNNNPHCYSDEFVARAKSVATLTMG